MKIPKQNHLLPFQLIVEQYVGFQAPGDIDILLVRQIKIHGTEGLMKCVGDLYKNLIHSKNPDASRHFWNLIDMYGRAIDHFPTQDVRDPSFIDTCDIAVNQILKWLTPIANFRKNSPNPFFVEPNKNWLETLKNLLSRVEDNAHYILNVLNPYLSEPVITASEKLWAKSIENLNELSGTDARKILERRDADSRLMNGDSVPYIRIMKARLAVKLDFDMARWHEHFTSDSDRLLQPSRKRRPTKPKKMIPN